MSTPALQGFLRADGRKGIRNHVAVVYLVECAHHVAREIGWPLRDRGVHVIGFPGCYPNAYAETILRRICTHPNVGAVLLVSLGCESFDRQTLLQAVVDSGRPAHLLVIQELGGTAATISAGREWLERTLPQIESCHRVPMGVEELVVATICGGSDATSGLTANPSVGRACDLLVQAGATVIFENTGELIGCEQFAAARAATPELGRQIVACVEKAARYYLTMGHASFAPGNAEGGLTTIEEKSLGAYCKTGKSTISGIIKPGDMPPRGGMYLLDIVPDGPVRFGFPNITDNAEIVELMASGCLATLFTTGRGSIVGSAIGPVVKVCANPDTFRRMRGDLDVNAGRILEGQATLDELGREIFEFLQTVAAGRPTASERLGHQEFLLTYKSFEPLGPACLAGG
jgi:altronate hydrolase